MASVVEPTSNLPLLQAVDKRFEKLIKDGGHIGLYLVEKWGDSRDEFLQALQPPPIPSRSLPLTFLCDAWPSMSQQPSP